MSDFTYTPDYVFEEEVNWKTQVSEFENGTEQRRRKWANSRRKFTLQYKKRSSTDLNNIKTFFNNKYGRFSSFTWTNPNDNVEYTVRFVEDSFKFSTESPSRYDFEFQFIEDK